jgi:signal transduction histidine kinase/ligand-binding sensor domain-containing protein
MTMLKPKKSFWIFKGIILYALFLNCYLAQAQISDKQLVHFDVPDGLPSKVTYSIKQDSSGFIWISTDAGIAYFDGYAFHNLTTKDGLPNNDAIDADYIDGKLWVSTLGPLSYITADFKIHRAPVTSANFSRYIDHQFAKDGSSVWVSRSNEVFRLDRRTLVPEPVDSQIFRQDSTDYWVFEHQELPWMVRKKKGARTELLQIAGNKINKSFEIGNPEDRVYFFSCASEKNLLYCHFNGNIMVINTDTGALHNLVEGRDLTSHIALNGNELWIVQPKNGVEIYELKNDTTAVYKKTLLKGFQPGNILIDKEGNIWISTLGNGLFFLPKQASAVRVLQKANGLSENTINSILGTNDHLVTGNRSNILEFFSSDQTGMTELTSRKQLRDRTGYSITNRILKIASNAPGKYFLATDLGLIHYNQGLEQLILMEAIKNLKFGANGDLLISSHRGVRKISASDLDSLTAKSVYWDQNFKRSAFIKPVIDGRSYASAVDLSGHIWAHTIAKGLVQFTPTDTIYWQERDPIFLSQIVDIAFLADSTVCVGTRGQGLILIKNHQYKVLNQDSLLASDFINVLSKDERGDLWIGTNNGLTHWSAPSFSGAGASLVSYSTSDGLLANNINDVTIWRDQVFIATNEGVMYFRPNEIINASKPSKLVLYPPLVNDTLQINMDIAHLKPDENNIQFSFTALNYQDRNTTTFLYRLKGLNDSWRSTKTPEVRYAGLQSGNYTFELKAITDKGLVSQLETPFDFKIKRPFTKSLIFYWLLGISGLGILLVLLQSVNRKARNQELNYLVKEKTKALQVKNLTLEDSNTKLRRSNQELTQFAYIAAHDLKSPLRSISSFVQLLRRRAAEKLNQEELEYIDFAVKGTQQLGKLIDDLQVYSQVTGNAQERTWNDVTELVTAAMRQIPGLDEPGVVSLDADLPKLWINTQNGQLLFSHLLSNASKFRHSERKLTLRIGSIEQNEQITLFVKDNGIGIHPQYQEKIFKIFQRLHTSDQYPGTGIGLAICKKIIEEENGKIWLSSKEGEGTAFYFTCRYKP